MRTTRRAALCVGLVVLFAGAVGADDADNTRRNVRDRGGETLTPLDQSEKAADRDLTAKIRKAIVEDESLSINAQNVKVITIDGVVTLRGPVKSETEKAAIDRTARSAAGATRVDNQLEVETE
jgi:osmotically-inducible protein OsmY